MKNNMTDEKIKKWAVKDIMRHGESLVFHVKELKKDIEALTVYCQRLEIANETMSKALRKGWSDLRRKNEDDEVVTVNVKHKVPSTIWFVQKGYPTKATIRGWTLRNDKGLVYNTYFGDLTENEIYLSEEEAENAIKNNVS